MPQVPHDVPYDVPSVPEASAEHVWISPGVSLRKRALTALAIVLAAALFIFIAASEGASMWVSTLIGALFIGCFVWYLRIVAPTPFTLRLDDTSIMRQERAAAGDDSLDGNRARERRTLQEWDAGQPGGV